MIMIKNQSNFINKFIEEDTDTILILFDACRFDIFKNLYNNYFEGNLEKVYNGGVTYTHDWFELHFNKPNDIILITPLPVDVENWISKFKNYNPEKCFKKINGINQIQFDHSFGSVKPENLNN